MGQEFARGVPQVLAMDGWWLDGDGGDGEATPSDTRRGAIRFGGLAFLVLLADLLFWHRTPGISLALFALAIFAVATWDGKPTARLVRPVLLLVLGALPVVEYVQALSVGFLLAGLAASLVWARVRPEDPWLATGLAWLARLPGAWAAPLNPDRWGHAFRALHRAPETGALRRLAAGWAFPVGGALVFAGLLVGANPVLGQALDLRPDVFTLLQRGLFWAGIALLVWPLLDRSLPRPVALPQTLPTAGPRFGLTRTSVLRALVMFNALIAVHTVMDAAILLGGAALPEGMNYAEYAHRGAYPLLATALLAGAFALAARPFLGEHRAIRPLLLLWLVQNVVLCGAALLRLELYIAAYGLTYLRVHAMIWMGLVALMLALAVWQVLRAHRNRWLLMRGALLGLATLYATAFVNVAEKIADGNLSAPATRQTDFAYICSLGPMAQDAYARAVAQRPYLEGVLARHGCALTEPRIAHWQEWGFRKARVGGYGPAEAEPTTR